MVRELVQGAQGEGSTSIRSSAGLTEPGVQATRATHA